MNYPPQQGPYGQQDPWGQQHQQNPYPPQTPPWLGGDPGGFPSFEPDYKKPKTGLITTLIIVGILVVGGGGFGLWMLLSKDDDKNGGGGGGGDDGGTDARAVAEQYVDELEKVVNTDIADIDLSPLEPLTCADDFGQMENDIGDAQDAIESGSEAPTPPGTVEAGMKDFQSTENEATFTLTQTIDGDEGPDTEMTMAKEEGNWTVCGLYDGGAPPESDPAPEESEAPDPSGGNGQVPNPIPTN
jgi:hypothetical protein